MLKNGNIKTMHCKKLASEIKERLRIFPYKNVAPDKENENIMIIDLIGACGLEQITYRVSVIFYNKYFTT